MTPAIVDELRSEVPEVSGLLPERYAYPMQNVFLEHMRPLLTPGILVLDVGAGRSPTIAPEQRPAGCRYVGLDISAAELRSAGPDAYDDPIAHDITRPIAVGAPFDLVSSWQVLEHVRPLDRALDNLREVLRPGGTLAQLSGSFAAFSLLARLVPHRLRVTAMARWLGSAEEEKFPTRCDRCYARALERMLAPWSSVALVPFYRGAVYFSMSRPVQRAYLRYESLVASKELRDLVTHYLIVAQR